MGCSLPWLFIAGVRSGRASLSWPALSKGVHSEILETQLLSCLPSELLRVRRRCPWPFFPAKMSFPVAKRGRPSSSPSKSAILL